MSNCEPKMAHSFRNVLLIAAVVTLTILAGSCEAQDGMSSDSAMPDSPGSSDSGASASPGSDSSVLPVPSATLGEWGRVVLIINQAVTARLARDSAPYLMLISISRGRTLYDVLRNAYYRRLPECVKFFTRCTDSDDDSEPGDSGRVDLIIQQAVTAILGRDAAGYLTPISTFLNKTLGNVLRNAYRKAIPGCVTLFTQCTSAMGI